ncbi:MAG: glycosyltransferase family 4 protein [Pirellulaceae bacterium]
MKNTMLLLSELFPPKTGGSGRWFWEIYRRLPREQVVVVAGEDPREADFDRTHDLRITRIPLSWREWGVIDFQATRNYARAYRAVRRVLRENDGQCVHCGRLLPEGWIAWLVNKICGTPYLCYVHGEELSYGLASRQLGWMMRRVLNGMDYAIANSRNTASILRDQWNVPADRIRLLHPGVDVERFVPMARDLEIRNKLGWQDRPVVLTVGRLQERKGHDTLIRALSQIRKTIPNVLYCIVGDGEQRPRLEELAQANGLRDYVQFRGEIDDSDLIECYQQCDLFVLPNREVNGDIEGFGMVLLEAQACGKPVVAGASGGTAETMRIPETGRTVPCDGPDELAQMIVELLSDPPLRDQMGRAARQWTVERFSWESLSQEASDLFSGVVPRKVAVDQVVRHSDQTPAIFPR